MKENYVVIPVGQELKPVPVQVLRDIQRLLPRHFDDAVNRPLVDAALNYVIEHAPRGEFANT